MSKNHSVSVIYPQKAGLKKTLLSCGIISSLFYFAINIYAPMQLEGYDFTSQTVSELSAIGSPTRPLWTLLVSVYSLFLIAFGYGVWKSAGENVFLRITGILIIVYTIIGLFWPPMHQREALAAGEKSISDTLHIAFTFATATFMMLVIAFAAAVFGTTFRAYSIATVVVIVAFGVLTGMAKPQLEANLPTPMIGIWERISIGAYMFWLMVFSYLMLKKK